MRYVSVNYNYSPDFTTPESWFKRTEGYAGILERLAVDNEVIYVKQIDYKGDHLHNGVDYRFVDFGKRKTFFPGRLNRYIKNLNPEVIIMQGLHHPVQMIQLCLSLGKNTKVIVHHHAEQPFTGIKKLLQKLADSFAHAYLFASHSMGLDWVTKGIISSPKKIHEVMEVSSNFYTVEKKTAQTSTGACGQPVFLWVGRLNNNKDPLTVVNAFLKYTETVPGARFYMIFHTDELLLEVQNLIEVKQSHKVILVGRVPHDRMLLWFNSADFFISGSHYEGSGTALCEAMSCGCVPIVTDIFSFWMITDNGKCGLLYPAGNEAALLGALIQTANLDMATEQKKALNRFRLSLSFEAIGDKINAVAKSLRGLN